MQYVYYNINFWNQLGVKLTYLTPARTCFTVSCKMAHLSGLTDKELMSAKLAEINSASSSMYMFSCSRRRFSLRHLFLKTIRITTTVKKRGIIKPKILKT